MNAQKTAHYRYKKKLQANDASWEEELRKRNEARNEYRRQLVIHVKQNKKERRLEQEIAGASDAWDMVRRLKTITRHKENPQPTLNNTEKQRFNEYWETLYADTDEIGPNERTDIEPPDKTTIKKVVDHLPMRKAPGPDGMTAELLKYGGNVTWEMTVRLVQLIWRQQNMPRQMCQANIFLIPKDRTDIKNPAQQRPISLTNVWTKVVDKLVYEKLLAHTEANKIISPNQAGFRKHHSCATQAFVMEQLIQVQKLDRGKVHACFIDLRKAFDSIKRNQLFKILRDNAYPPDVVAILQEMYEKESSKLILNGMPDREWRVKRGVRQGAVTSPLLFNLIPEQLTRRLKRHGTGIKLQGLERIN